MINHRITRAAAVALAIGAVSAPAAAAEPIDTHAPGMQYTQPHGFLRADAEPESTFDRRNPDTVDYANGRGTYNSPEVVVVDLPQPVAEPASIGGIDWADAGLGAGSLLGITLIGLGGALFVVHRRGARALAS